MASICILFHCHHENLLQLTPLIAYLVYLKVDPSSTRRLLRTLVLCIFYYYLHKNLGECPILNTVSSETSNN